MSNAAVSVQEHQDAILCPKVQGRAEDSMTNTREGNTAGSGHVEEVQPMASITDHGASNDNRPTAPPLHAMVPSLLLQHEEGPLQRGRQVRQASTLVVEGLYPQTLQGATELESHQRDEPDITNEPRKAQHSSADSTRRTPILDLCAFLDGMSTNAIVPEHALAQEIAAITGIVTEGGDTDSLNAPGLRVGSTIDACGVLAYMLRVEGSMDTFPGAVVKASIRAVQRLWPSCRVRMHELNVFRPLGDVCMLHLGTMDIVIVGLHAISVIANEEDDKQALGFHRCNEFIVAALRVFSSSADVQRLACDAIVAMADDAANAEKMGEAGVVGTMAQLFHVFVGDTTTLEHGCRALQVLARDYQLLRSLTKAGLCDQLLRAFVQFQGVRSFQEAGMAAVVQLAYTADNMRKIGKHGGVEAVITALQAFTPGTENRGVFEVALMLVRRLAMDQNNRRSLARHMAPQIVCRVLTEYAEDARIQEWGCAAISILALDEDMCETLRACGGLLSATAALQRFGEDRAIQNVAKLVVRRLAAPPGAHSMPPGASKRGSGGAGQVGELGAGMPRGAPAHMTERQPKAMQPGMRGAVRPPSPSTSCIPTRGAWPARPTLTPQASPFEPRKGHHAPRPALQQTSRLDLASTADPVTQQLTAVLAQTDAGIVAPQSLVKPRFAAEGSMLSMQERPAISDLNTTDALMAVQHKDMITRTHEAQNSNELRAEQLVEAMLTEADAEKPSSPTLLQEPQPRPFRIAPGPPERRVDEAWVQDRAQTLAEQPTLQAEQHTSASVMTEAPLLPPLQAQAPVLIAQVPLQQCQIVGTATPNQVVVTQRLMSGVTRLADVGEVLQALSQIRTSITTLHPNSPLRVAAGLCVSGHVREDGVPLNVVDTADALLAILDNRDMPVQVASMVVLAVINLINPTNPSSGPHRVRLRALGLIKALLRAIARHPTDCPDLLDHVFICLCLVSSEGFHHARDVVRTIMQADMAGIFQGLKAMDLFIGPMQRTLRAHGGHLAVQHGFLMLISAWWTHNTETRKEQLNMSEGLSAQPQQDGQPGEKSNAVAFYGQAISLVLSAMKSLSKGPHMQCQGSFYLAEVGSAREAFYSSMVQEGACDVVASALGALHPASAKCCQKNVLRAASVLAARPRGREALRFAGGGELLVRAYCTLDCGWDVLSYAGMGVLSLAHEGVGMRQMVHVGAIEVVVAMMRAYGNDRTWQTPAAAWLHRVAMDDNESRSRLIRSGSVPVLLQAMQRFRAAEDKDIQADCVGALFCMTRQGGMAMHRPLVDAGLVGLLTFALCTYPTHQPLVTRVIPFLSLLASNGAASYPGKPSVREVVAVALSNLDGSDKSQVPPAQLDPLDALVVAVRSFVVNREVQHYGMDLIWMLAVYHPTNIIKLSVMGAPECAMTVMRQCAGNIGPAGSACGALAALSEHPDNRLRMIEAGAVQSFLRVLAAFPAHKEIQKNAIRGALRLLNDEPNIRRAGGWERHEHGHVLSARDACEPLLKALHSYPLEMDIQFTGCWVVWKLASGSSERRKVLGELGAGELLVAALWSSSFRREVQYVCCGALYAMAEEGPRARNAVEQATTSYQLLEAALTPFAMGPGLGAAQAPTAHDGARGEVGKWLLGVKEGDEDEGVVRRRLIRCGARAAVEAAKVTWRGDEQISNIADMALSRLV